MSDPVDIRPDHLEIVRGILGNHLPSGVQVWVFGSRADWSTKDSSDLDLALEGEGRLSNKLLGELSGAFEDSSLPYAVDVVDMNRISDSFKQIVESQRLPLPQSNAETAQTTSSDWRQASIEEVAEKVAMGPFGSSIKVETFVPEGVPIISGKHLRGLRVDDAPGFNFIKTEHAQELSNAVVTRGDIVLTHRGNIGQAAYVPSNSRFSEYVISQSQFYLRCDKSKVLPEFVTYYFNSPEGRHQLLANTSQVGVPSIAKPVTYLRTIQIPTPPLKEQRAIARILGTLDDKIELNHRMNKTLEAMARALFKSWFVDFDPVRAKMDGRWKRGQSLPGLPAELYGLFPDRLVDSDLGEIPQGWDVGRLAEQININPKRRLSKGQVAPYLPMANMPTQGHTPTSLSMRPFGSGVRFAQGDTLVARITPCLENGKTAFVDFLADEEIGWGSTEYIVLKPRPPLPNLFAYCLARSDRFRKFAIQNMSGTSGRQRVSAAALREYVIVAPPDSVVMRFGVATEPLFQRVNATSHESQTLSALRDTLLPKLISGDIRVSQAERAVGTIA